MFKFKSLLIQFVILLLVACVPVSSGSAAASTSVPATPFAPTPASPTATPTVEVSPTPAGPKEGDTKVENGYTYTYTAVKTAEGKEAYKGWFRPMTPTAIPLIDWPWLMSDGTQGKDVAPITILVEDGVSGADDMQAFTHTPIPKGPGNNRYLGYMITAFSNNDDALWAQQRTELQTGTLKYPVQFGTTSFDFYPSPKHGSNVYILNPKDPAISKENGSVEWTDGAIYNHKFKTIFWGLDAEGNTQGGIASETPLDQLDPNERLIFPFYHLASIIGGTGDDLKLYSGGYSQLLQRMMESSQKSDPPYVEISTQTPPATPTP